MRVISRDMWKRFFVLAVADPVLHRRFLMGIGQLEYIGARKIALSLEPFYPNPEYLQHASEEFRHAFFFLNQAKKLSSSATLVEDSSSFLRPHFVCRYLHYLDAHVSRVVKGCVQRQQVSPCDWKRLCYLLVTKLVELRAVELYDLYNLELKRSGSFQISWLLREESAHLGDINHELDQISFPLEVTSHLEDFEQNLFAAFEKEVFSWIAQLD